MNKDLERKIETKPEPIILTDDDFKNIKPERLFTKAQVRWIALATAAAVSLGAYLIEKATFRPIVPNSVTVTKEDPKTLGNDMNFDPNSNQAMIDRISSIYVDALPKGINNITVEQWTDFYTVANINDIDPNDYSRLHYNAKTKESIMRNFDFVLNTMLDDTITSTPNTIIDLSSLIADEKSAEAIKALQEKIAMFNVSNNKKAAATELNEFITNEFITENYKQVDPAANLIRFKLLLAAERLTSSSNYRIPTKDASKIIFGNGQDCSLSSKSTVNTKYNGEKTIVKEMLGSKLQSAQSAKNDTNVEAIELLTGVEIEMKINDKIKASNVKYVANPSVVDAINANKPIVVPSTSTTNKPTSQPTTPKPVVTEPTQAEKEAVKAETEKQLEKENANENLRVVGVMNGSKEGYDDGLADGYNGANYNDNFGTVAGDKIYRDAYTESYKKQYNLGYSDGVAKREREKNSIIKEEITPLPQYDKNHDGKIDNNVIVPNYNNNNNKPKEPIIKEEFVPAPGYHLDDKGRLIDDSTGLPVEVISSLDSYKALKEICVAAVQNQNTDTDSKGQMKLS